MALIIAGYDVEGANSYVTDQEYINYAAATGREIGADAATREVELYNGFIEVESRRNKYQGYKSQEKGAQFPRTGLVIDSYPVSSDAVPDEVKHGQIELSIQSRTQDLRLSDTVQPIKREKLSTLEIEYQDGSNFNYVTTEKADQFLKPLYKNGGNQSGLMYRV